MKEFVFKTGTKVIVTEKTVEIVRLADKAALKKTLQGRFIMSLKNISGVIIAHRMLLICAPGFPAADKFRGNMVEAFTFPNCLNEKNEELQELYDYLKEKIAEQ